MVTIKNTSRQTLQLFINKIGDMIRIRPREKVTVPEITPQIQNLMQKQMLKRA